MLFFSAAFTSFANSTLMAPRVHVLASRSTSICSHFFNSTNELVTESPRPSL